MPLKVGVTSKLLKLTHWPATKDFRDSGMMRTQGKCSRDFGSPRQLCPAEQARISAVQVAQPIQARSSVKS